MRGRAAQAFESRNCTVSRMPIQRSAIGSGEQEEQPHRCVCVDGYLHHDDHFRGPGETPAPSRCAFPRLRMEGIRDGELAEALCRTRAVERASSIGGWSIDSAKAVDLSCTHTNSFWISRPILHPSSRDRRSRSQSGTTVRDGHVTGVVGVDANQPNRSHPSESLRYSRSPASPVLQRLHDTDHDRAPRR
jgi:hypothetical protein